MAINHGFGLGAINHGFGLGAINHGFGLGAINHGFGLGAMSHGYGLGETSTSTYLLSAVGVAAGLAVGYYGLKHFKKKGLAGARSRKRRRARRR
jgi:hypothetical protein